MIAKATSAAVNGLEVIPVTVEVDISNGLPGLTIVGLPDKAVDESRERVRSAIKACGVTLPAQRIVVNLAPASIRKEGPAFDLPIAVAVLAAAEQIPPPAPGLLFAGELSLSGEINGVRGVLAMAAAAARFGITDVCVATGVAPEASLAGTVSVRPAATLQAVIDYLRDEQHLPVFDQPVGSTNAAAPEVDFADVRGQPQAKRALELAAAGGHNVLLTGPPGTGKTLLSKALAGILPMMTRAEMLEVTTIYSVAGALPADQPLITERPFRSPHHSVSLPAMVGGGSIPRPGDITLAHRGVLYLDEVPQFPRHVLEALRGPLEDGQVRISRAQQTVNFPSRCMLVASENPCPCGQASDPLQRCTCSPITIERYRQRLSGPIRDRFDMTVEVPRLSYETLQDRAGESTAVVRERVEQARRFQYARYGEGKVNAALTPREIERLEVTEAAAALLRVAVDRWHVSVRGYHRILKVARTIADLAGEETVTETVVAEALQHRQGSGVPA